MMPFNYHRDARQEHLSAIRYYVSAIRYYADQSKNLGEDYAQEVQDTIDKICLNPRRYALIGRTVRKCNTDRFQYKIIYTVETDGILIVAVAHHSRRPGYWRYRLNTP